MRKILYPPEDCSPGDVIFFAPTDMVGGLVSLLTWPWWPFSSRYAHVGIVVLDGETLLLVESTRDQVLGPCVWSGVHMFGVQAHPLAERLEAHRRRGGRAWRFPLRKELTADGRADLYLAARRIRGSGYDLAGALRARDGVFGRFIRWVVKSPGNGKFLYCNEAVGVILKRLGLLTHDFVPDQFNPKSFAAELLRRGVTHEPIPLIA